MRVLIADDHPVFRGGLRRVLEDHGHQVVAECEDGSEVALEARTTHPDIILLDLQMPGQHGIEILSQLSEGPPIVVLTVSEDDSDIQAALDAGASGYLLRSSDPGDIVRAMDSVAHGYRLFPDGLAGESTNDDDVPQLSERQAQVLDCLVRGMTHKEVAETLGISQHTVRTYQERLLEKYGVQTRAELIYAAHSSEPVRRARDS